MMSITTLLYSLEPWIAANLLPGSDSSPEGTDYKGLLRRAGLFDLAINKRS